MRVKLIQMTENPMSVMWVAARTCYSEKSPIELWSTCGEVDIDKKWKLVRQVLSSGHQSIAENISFSFAIEGVSRSLLAQITRHRAGVVFAVQSQRYVEIKEDYKLLGDDGTEINETNYLERTDLLNILDKYFVWDYNNYAQFHALLQSLYCYLYQVQEMGMKPEDARYVLPNATKTNMTMTINLRELMHVCALRLCNRASLEIRELFKAIKEEVDKVEPKLAGLLVPSCEVNGFCTEHKCCGRKPHISKVIREYNSEDKLTPELIEAMKNPKFNEKLSELIKMQSVIE